MTGVQYLSEYKSILRTFLSGEFQGYDPKLKILNAKRHRDTQIKLWPSTGCSFKFGKCVALKFYFYQIISFICLKVIWRQKNTEKVYFFKFCSFFVWLIFIWFKKKLSQLNRPFGGSSLWDLLLYDKSRIKKVFFFSGPITKDLKSLVVFTIFFYCFAWIGNYLKWINACWKNVR